ncbi:MAG: SURF1 family protein [Alphaproteobacteria bacterium]|nr:SURF1 family protein [Alphaproteobacteria bacterium]OJV13902.1 MAG: hypothetical protein BGO27_08415 [Alphaproteobacteria bacterium 33-17]
MPSKKSKLPLFMTVVMVLILLFLGSWQIVRYQYKTALQHELDQKITKEPEKVSCEKLHQIYNKDLNFRRLILDKAQTTGENVFVFAGSRAIRGESGYFLVTQVKCDSYNFIINMGWIPVSHKEKFMHKKWVLDDVLVTIMPNEIKRVFTPENDVKLNVWFYINSQNFSEYFKINDPGFFMQRSYLNNEYPIGQNAKERVRNDHMGYALTWYMLAIANLVIYAVYKRKRV